MRSFGRILFWLYRALSLVIIIIGLIQLIMFRNNSYFALKVLIPIIIVDLLLLCVTTLVSMLRKGGWPSIAQLLRSTRFRLTLWYTLILAIVLLIFSTIVYATVCNDLNGVISTNLRSH